MRMDYNTLK